MLSGHPQAKRRSCDMLKMGLFDFELAAMDVLYCVDVQIGCYIQKNVKLIIP